MNKEEKNIIENPRTEDFPFYSAEGPSIIYEDQYPKYFPYEGLPPLERNWNLLIGWIGKKRTDIKFYVWMPIKNWFKEHILGEDINADLPF